MAPLPNLWHDSDVAASTYEVMLIELWYSGQYQEAISGCRTIRRYAKGTPHERRASFTYGIEIDALGAMQQYSTAWRQLRRWEVARHGSHIDFSALSVPPECSSMIPRYHAPLLYFLKKYALGVEVLESCSRGYFSNYKSSEQVRYVYNRVQYPVQLAEVTLFHFYRQLGRDLTTWECWPHYVRGIASKHLTRTGVKRSELMRDSSQLAKLWGGERPSKV